MPSLSSVTPTGAPAVTPPAGPLVGSTESVIARSLLPFAALHAEPGNRDRSQQERDHGGRNRRALAETARKNAALITQRRHQMRGVHRSAARQGPDQLEIGEGEQHRK